MRHSLSVHNALVLNLRSGDAHLDVRGRSPPHPLSLLLFLSAGALHLIFTGRRFSLYSPLDLAFEPRLRKLPTVLPLDWRFVTRNHTRWIIGDVTPPRCKTAFPRSRWNGTVSCTSTGASLVQRASHLILNWDVAVNQPSSIKWTEGMRI